MPPPLVIICSAVLLDAMGLGLIFLILPALLKDVTVNQNVAPHTSAGSSLRPCPSSRSAASAPRLFRRWRLARWRLVNKGGSGADRQARSGLPVAAVNLLPIPPALFATPGSITLVARSSAMKRTFTVSDRYTNEAWTQVGAIDESAADRAQGDVA